MSEIGFLFKSSAVVVGICFAVALIYSYIEQPKKGTNQPVSNALDDFHVQKLFTTDDCTVYRFYDRDNYHYFTNCSETISEKTEYVGKIVKHYDESIKKDIFDKHKQISYK